MYCIFKKKEMGKKKKLQPRIATNYIYINDNIYCQ